MTRYECFRKEGTRYSSVPYRTCNVPSEVFLDLADTLRTKFLHHSECIRKIDHRRCPYCDSFEEITVYWELPNGERSKTVYTVPLC